MAEVDTQAVAVGVAKVQEPMKQWVVAPADNPVVRMSGETPAQADYFGDQAEKKFEKAVKQAKKEKVDLPELDDKDKTYVMRGFEGVVEKRNSPEREARLARIEELRVDATKLSTGDELFSLLKPKNLTNQQYQELSLILEQQGLTKQELLRIQSAQKFITRFDEKEEQFRRAQELYAKQVLLARNEKYQRQQLGVALEQNKDLLGKAAGEEMLNKATVIVEADRGVVTIDALEEQVARLNTQVAQALGEYEGKPDNWQKVLDEDTAKLTEKRSKKPYDLTETEAISKKAEDLTEQEARSRSTAVQGKATLLVEDLNKIRREKNEPELTQIEINQLRADWGIVEMQNGTETLYLFKEDSVMESFLLAEAFAHDGKKGWEQAMKKVDGGDIGALEEAVLAGDMMVKGQAMEQIAHALVVETMDQGQMGEALKVARKLGLMEDASRLEKMLEGSKDMVRGGTKFIKESIHKLVDWLKDPEGGKKMGKYLLYGLLGILAILLVTTVLGASAMAGALGGGGR